MDKVIPKLYFKRVFCADFFFPQFDWFSFCKPSPCYLSPCYWIYPLNSIQKWDTTIVLCDGGERWKLDTGFAATTAKECSIHVLKNNMEWINATVDWVWLGEKLIMNIAMINTCQRPISFSNGFQRDCQQAQCEHALWLFWGGLFFFFISLHKKASSAVFSHKINPGLYMKLSTGLWVEFVSFCK